jgi:hypothetical protein
MYKACVHTDQRAPQRVYPSRGDPNIDYRTDKVNTGAMRASILTSGQRRCACSRAFRHGMPKHPATFGRGSLRERIASRSSAPSGGTPTSLIERSPAPPAGEVRGNFPLTHNDYPYGRRREPNGVVL